MSVNPPPVLPQGQHGLNDGRRGKYLAEAGNVVAWAGGFAGPGHAVNANENR